MRVMMDTNLWSSVGDEGVARSFDKMVTARGLEVVVPPSTLLEVIRLPVPHVRQRIIEAMAMGPRRRLATEAQSESAEVINEVRRVRPGWIRSMPDTGRVASLNTFWTKQIWRRALQDSQPLHESQMRQRPRSEYLVRRQRDQRAEMLKSKFGVRPLTAILATPIPEAPDWYLDGWSGEPVEMWRLECRDLYWRELATLGGRAFLTGEDATFADWIGAYVDLSKLRSDRADFTRFWVSDVVIEEMKRNWIRWAIRLAQAALKITAGNPADEQHSSYLVECDLFLSADARYVSTLELLRADAPFSVAESRLVSGDRSIAVLDRVAAVL
ncbi:hypothetical protein O7626_35315 [Micromonospora sp. WMMD1102]|uniref:hypothetical protein n=1 Tax=Micromonosporaceae TaxID=28056 RepID=UPI002414DA55|nr:hypothetical protein [Micromonospora sp. WMMD1102]MDG4791116.1 hypothetical protein [Micromonospora sp. WMMD1102]